MHLGNNYINIQLKSYLLIFRDLYKEYEKNNSVEIKKKQDFCKRCALVYIPFFVMIFVIVYWFIGLQNAHFF